MSKRMLRYIFTLYLFCMIISFAPDILVQAEDSLIGASILMDEFSTLNAQDTTALTTMMVQQSYTEKELNALYTIVEAEVTGDGNIEPKIHVTHVILNRVLSKDFPNTILDVIYQDGQFQPLDDGRFWTVKPTQETIDAVNKALVTKDTTNGADFFCRYDHMPDWKKKKWLEGKLFIMADSVGHSFFRSIPRE